MIRKRLLILSVLSVSILSISCVKSKVSENEECVKNVILMIGDGMGFSHISSAIYWQEEPIQMLRSESGGAITTHSANSKVTDSAAAGTALACGQKTNNGMVGMTPDSVAINSVMKMAKNAGFATGLITTTTITHATPASFYANIESRKHEAIIATQLLDNEIDILIGGGAKHFTGEGEANLVDDFESKGYSVVFDTLSTYSIKEGKLLALLSEGYITPKKNREDILPKATLYSANRLSKMSEKGFLLMVESGQIDSRAHSNDSEGVIEEMAEFDRAVGEAFTFADNNPGTLVVVVADHETGGLTLHPNKNVKSGIDLKFSSKGHTGTLVPMFAYGAGAEKFSGIKDNTDIPKIIAELIGVKWE